MTAGAAEPGPGSVVGGYRIESLVAADAMGMVFRARDERTSQRVALRVLAPQWAQDLEFRLQFVAQCRALTAAGSPSIVPVYAAGEDNGSVFAAQRLVSGPDAGTLLLREHGALPPARVLELVSPVASALDAAHRVRLVHGDVRPANIVTDEEGQVYLAGFGLSPRAGGPASLADDCDVPGPSPYAAPEQLRGDIIGGRADQYSLARVACQLLAGHLPGEGDEAGAGLPVAARLVLDRALAADPAARYRSCEQFTQALGGALRPVVPPAAGPAGAARRAPVVRSAGRDAARSLRRTGRKARSRRRRAVLIGLAVIVVAAAIAIPSWLASRTAPAPAPSRIAALTDTQVYDGLDPEAIAFAPEADTLIAVDDNGYIERWDTATGVSSYALEGTSGPIVVDAGAFSPDGSVVAIPGEGSSVELWEVPAAGRGGDAGDAHKRAVAMTLPGISSAESHVYAIAFSPDGRTLAVSASPNAQVSYHNLYLFDTATGKLIRTIPDFPATVAFSPDGATIATSDGDGTIRLWNVATGALEATIGTRSSSYEQLYSVTFSPDGRSIAAVTGNGTTDVWDVAARRQVAALAGSGSDLSFYLHPPQVAFSPDGRAIVTVTSDTRLWDAATYRSVATIPGAVSGAAFSPDGRVLATANMKGTISLWRVPAS